MCDTKRMDHDTTDQYVGFQIKIRAIPPNGTVMASPGVDICDRVRESSSILQRGFGKNLWILADWL